MTEPPDPTGPGPSLSETRTHDGDGARPAFTGPQRIAGYRILREIGSGGMGTVFEAYEEAMHRAVALKVMSRHHAPSEKADRRFEHEAWIGGRLNHPTLVKVYERGSWEELSYYSMELVRGGSLHDVVSNMKRWGRDDRIGLEFGSAEYVRWAIERILEAARGLDYAHRQGVVHRDIKPMNLLLGEDRRSVKIADFGVAIDAETTRLTTAGKLLGTLVYMAPEQILGKVREFDGRTDIYALGVTLFELLTLELPFVGKTQQLYLNAVLTSEARRPSRINHRVSRDLEIVIRKALEKAPSDRYASAADLAADLENVLHFRPIVATPSSPVRRASKWVRRRPAQAALLGLLILGVPAVGLLSQRAVERNRLVREKSLEALWNEILWLWQEQRNGPAVEALSQILVLDPGNARAVQLRAVGRMRLALSEEDPARRDALEEASLEDLSLAERLRPEAAWPHRLRAFVLRRLGREGEAREADAEAARHLPSASPDDVVLDAYAALDAQDHERAARLLSEVVARSPGSVDHLYWRARALEALGRTEEAIRDYRVAVALSPETFVFHHNLGLLLTRAGSLDDGKAHLERALEIEPQNASSHEALSYNLLGQAQRAASEADDAAALGFLERAEQEARRSLELDPGLLWARLNLGASLMERNRRLERPDPGLIREATESYDAAISGWREGRGLADPAIHGTAALNYCDALLQLRDLTRAGEACGEAVRLLPDHPAAHYNLAAAHALSGRKEEAFAELERDFDLGDRDWGYLSRDPWFDSLRGDRRFAALLARMRREG